MLVLMLALLVLLVLPGAAGSAGAVGIAVGSAGVAVGSAGPGNIRNAQVVEKNTTPWHEQTRTKSFGNI